MATATHCAPFEMIRRDLSEVAGFPLDFMEYSGSICFPDVINEGQIHAHLVAGEHRTVLTLDMYSVAMRDNAREAHDIIFSLIAAGIRDIQGQWHHENDYQLAVQQLALEAVACPSN